MKVIVLGANGMLGNACMNYLLAKPNFTVRGTVRFDSSLNFFNPELRNFIIPDINISDEDVQKALIEKEKPDVVINCVGIVKQSVDGNDYLRSITLNSLLPHQLSKRCEEYGSRLIHISTDCVFSGLKGSSYLESDKADANDLYGKTKFLGEVIDEPHVLTIRTSYIGNELSSANGLLEWFLSQGQECQGFTKAIYSGMPSIALAQVIENVLLGHPELSGLYQVASAPISKYNLLKLIANVFNKKINIIPNDDLIIDRSLDGSLFRKATGFIAPSWEEMIEKMYLDRIANVQK
jgi:dTDP-4-dehydrorhamnose reductase